MSKKNPFLEDEILSNLNGPVTIYVQKLNGVLGLEGVVTQHSDTCIYLEPLKNNTGKHKPSLYYKRNIIGIIPGIKSNRN